MKNHKMIFGAFFVFVITGSVFGETYINPVGNDNYPDPGILELPDGSGYVVVTSSPDISVKTPHLSVFPILFSKDLVEWQKKGYVFDEINFPTWAETSFWAPEIHFVNGSFHVYFSMQKNSGDKSLALGVAVSSSGPFGPYEDLGKPLLSHPDGIIDVTWFQDPQTNSTYLAWKRNQRFDEAFIEILELSPDGASVNFNAEPKTILTASNEYYDNYCIEAPWFIFRNGFYYLFYSGNNFDNPNYYVGVARSKHILGPYERLKRRVLRSDIDCYEEKRSCTFVSPGHASTARHQGEDWMVYHAWRQGQIGNGHNRVLNLDKLYWDKNDWPYIGYPSDGRRPKPGTKLGNEFE